MTLIFNGSDNNVSIPAIQGGTGGTSTGIYYPSANAIAIATGGVNALTISNTQAVTFSGAVTQTGNASFSANVAVTGSITSTNTFGYKNKLINGAMMIDQRNSGANATGTGYTVDRWQYSASQTSKFTYARNLNSVTPPTGFINYLGFQSSSSYSVGASDYFSVNQIIEGLNIADLAWGTANAKTITLSFWVRSSLTGTFGGSLGNNGFTYAYPFSYSIPVANTWTQISITIAGPTTGTWLTTNGRGVYVLFGLGYGSTYGNGTAGAWVAADLESVTGAVSVVGTSGATWYVTGVQFEIGSQATSFDFRNYGYELDLCERYYETGSFTIRTYSGGGTCGQFFPFSVTKRTGASMTAFNTTYAYNCSDLVLGGGYTSGFEMYLSTSASWACVSAWYASAEL